MSTVGTQLREAREGRKLTLQQVAEATKIRADHLQALEEGNFGVFPAPVYIRGSVRSYSALLKMDVAQTMAALEAELVQTGKFSEPPRFSEQPRSVLDTLMLQLTKLDWRKGLIALGAVLVLGVAAGAFFLWRAHQKSDPLKGLKPGVYQSNQSVSGETLPLPSPAPKR